MRCSSRQVSAPSIAVVPRPRAIDLTARAVDSQSRAVLATSIAVSSH